MNRATLEKHFWLKVDKGKRDDCWEWLGAKFSTGYGHIQFHTHTVRVHRLAWEIANGPIPKGMQVLHHCDNRSCCNPNHLFLGVDADNMADRDAKGRQARGEQNGQAKLAEQDIHRIRHLLDRYVRQADIADMFDVTPQNIYCIRTGKSWAWLHTAKSVMS